MPALDSAFPAEEKEYHADLTNGHAINGHVLNEKTPNPQPILHVSKTLPATLPSQPPLETVEEDPQKQETNRDSITVSKHRRSVAFAEAPQIHADEDAARWAERIKERRISSKRRRDEEIDDDRVLIGTKVAEGHDNFETAYNMLTGIRFGVSRCNAKINRGLTDEDFRERRKTSFDVLGTELTPATKYDFKFKDYAPWVFRHLRDIFRIDPANYLMSLTDRYILSELGSPGKSGSFFYFSRNYRYIIKTVHHHEAKFLRKILPEYYNHVRKYPDTLLSQFYGLHRVKTSNGKKFHFVVMNNLFPPHKDIHCTYDLKGSLVGREFDESKLAETPLATLKDLNWIKRDMHLEFGPTKADRFKWQLDEDVKFLQRLGIMDYSLLVGIHDMSRGNSLNLRNKTLKVFQPGGERTTESANPNQPPNLLVRTPSRIENARKANQLRQLVRNERPVPMEQTFTKMPERQAVDESKKNSFFYGEEGGMLASDEFDAPGREIYYLGIIDCLTKYSFIKKAEHMIKSFSQPDAEISAVPPKRYGDRFYKFMTNAITPSGV